ncbi:hypothetical protein FRC10_008638 [Ceratobasidium sp. 414]|nr:hypothetical protein FRC10_008638 [Ceratobasidium sp. 414]
MAFPTHLVMVDSSLKPIVPSEVNRYATPTCWSSESAPTPASTSGDYIVHPEGSLIYWDDKLVSSQPITSIHQSLCAHILSRCDESIDQAEITVFVEIRDRSQADYYVVVHDSKTIVWVEHQLPGSFADATSAKHDYEYWTHMENFPGPSSSSPEDRQNLVNVLASMAIDASTSDGSTSPMPAEQIQCHLQMLNSFGGDVDKCQTYAVARLWNIILQSRMLNKYGTPEARLDRFVDVCGRPPQFTGPHDAVDKLMFGIPRAHLGRCSRAWADRIVYVGEWRRFKMENEQEWQRMMPSATYFQAREERSDGLQKIAIVNAVPQALLAWSFIFLLAAVTV